jgi:hypothetical protein
MPHTSVSPLLKPEIIGDFEEFGQMVSWGRLLAEIIGSTGITIDVGDVNISYRNKDPIFLEVVKNTLINYQLLGSYIREKKDQSLTDLFETLFEFRQ